MAILNCDDSLTDVRFEAAIVRTDTANTDDTKKRELLKNPTKIEEIQETKFIDIN